MAEPQRGWSDQRVEQFLGNLLRVGVLLAATVVLAGGVLYLLQHGKEVKDFGTFEGEPDHLRSFAGIIGSAFQGESRGIIQLGLLLLIATPVARVVFSVFAFALQRDRIYVVLTLIVLCVLLFSLAGGHL